MKIPPWPQSEAPSATSVVPLRYEDITQEGRLGLELAPHALGETVWKRLLQHEPKAQALLKSGVIPILARLRVEGLPGPFSVDGEVEARGTYVVADSLGPDGQVDHVYLNMWGELSARHGHTYRPGSADVGPRAVAARVFAVHVMTRLFAPAGQRRVTSLPPDAMLHQPIRMTMPPATDLLRLPEGAVAIDAALVIDPTPLVFGLLHTDSNQHVNSLVYLRAFEEALLRRLHARGRSTAVLSREVEIVYRKPCFAGQVVQVALQAFELDGKVGACGVFLPADAGVASLEQKPYATVQMVASGA